MKNKLKILFIVSASSTLFYLLYFTVSVKVLAGVFPCLDELFMAFIIITLVVLCGELLIGYPLAIILNRKKILNFFSFSLIGGIVGLLIFGGWLVFTSVDVSKVLFIVTFCSVASAHAVIWTLLKNEIIKQLGNV